MVFDAFCKKVQEKFADEHDKKSLSTFIFLRKFGKAFFVMPFSENISSLYMYIFRR